MDSYDKSKQPIRPLSRAVGASHVLAVVAIAAAVVPIVVLWVFRPPLNYDAAVFTGHAIGWITALIAYALSSEAERALPLISVAANFVISGVVLFFYCWIDAVSNGSWTVILIPTILDFILPIAAFFTIMFVKARLRAKNG